MTPRCPTPPRAAAAAILALTFAQPGIAQEVRSGAFAQPVEVIQIEPLEINSDPATFRERVARTTGVLRQADAALRDQSMASMQSVMQGHQQGFTSFETWYLRRDADLRAEAAERQVLASILSVGMTQSLNLLLPGSGVFISTLRTGLNRSYGAAVNRMAAFEGGDPQIFLAEQREALETIRSEFLGQATSIPAANPEAWDALKWEYVFEFEFENDPNRTSTAPSARIAHIALTYGLPQPGEATIRRVALIVLEENIAGVLRADRDFMAGLAVTPLSRSNYVKYAARLGAYRHFFAGQPDVYCPVELDLYDVGLLGAGSECLAWRDRT